MRSRRSVTLQPIGMPSRSLKLAIDLRARVTTGFWPADRGQLAATAASTSCRPATASPTPMLMTIFSSRGTCMRVLVAELLLRLGAHDFVVVLVQPGSS